MNLKFFPLLRPHDGEIVAYFGAARLLKKLDGTFELVGGSPGDRTEAKEWISLFLHDAVLQDPARGPKGPGRRGRRGQNGIWACASA